MLPWTGERDGQVAESLNVRVDAYDREHQPRVLCDEGHMRVPPRAALLWYRLALPHDDVAAACFRKTWSMRWHIASVCTSHTSPEHMSRTITLTSDAHDRSCTDYPCPHITVAITSHACVQRQKTQHEAMAQFRMEGPTTARLC